MSYYDHDFHDAKERAKSRRKVILHTSSVYVGIGRVVYPIYILERSVDAKLDEPSIGMIMSIVLITGCDSRLASKGFGNLSVQDHPPTTPTGVIAEIDEAAYVHG